MDANKEGGSRLPAAEALPPVAWAEIDLNALAANMRALAMRIGSVAEIMPAVKANAYGHGAVRVAETLLANGASMLAVARLSEAAELRDAGITAPILMLGNCLSEHVKLTADMNVWASVNSFEEARVLASEAQDRGVTLRCHIKIDTGMGRLGIIADGLPAVGNRAAIEQVRDICELKGLAVDGIFTHLAAADSADKSSAKAQVARFANLVQQTDEAKLNIKWRHAANSAACIDMPDACFNLVRPGIAVYGLAPSHDIDIAALGLAPVMSLKTKIIGIKHVEAGYSVSYGGTFTTKRPSIIAAVAIGYGDGYSRSFSNRGFMLAGGRRVPVAGRVCMDLTMLDVTDAPHVAVGDEVVVFGKQADEIISADELADMIGTINYEITTGVAARVRRVCLV